LAFASTLSVADSAMDAMRFEIRATRLQPNGAVTNSAVTNGAVISGAVAR
jgi:hypothetical protein